MDCTGYTIAPAGQSAHRMEVQLKIGVVEGGTWDPADDPSYQAAAGPNQGVPLYEGSTRVWGNEPGTAPHARHPSGSPSPTRRRRRARPAVADALADAAAARAGRAACRVTYTTNDWNTGFTATVTVTNTGTTARERVVAGLRLRRRAAGDPGLVGDRHPVRDAGHADQRQVERLAGAGRVGELRDERHAQRQQPAADGVHPQRLRLRHRLTTGTAGR